MTLSFLKWLAGFIDGDGTFHFYIYKAKDGNYRCPTISIAQKERSALDYIKQQIGFGNICYIKSSECWYYEVSGIKRVSYLVNLVGKYIMTNKKQNQVHTLAYNNICKLPKFQNKISYAWLAGLWEADGWTSLQKCYYKSKMYSYITWGLCQQNELGLLQRIQEFLGIGQLRQDIRLDQLTITKESLVRRLMRRLLNYCHCSYKISKYQQEMLYETR